MKYSNVNSNELVRQRRKNIFLRNLQVKIEMEFVRSLRTNFNKYFSCLRKNPRFIRKHFFSLKMYNIFCTNNCALQFTVFVGKPSTYLQSITVYILTKIHANRFFSGTFIVFKDYNLKLGSIHIWFPYSIFVLYILSM